MHGEALPQTRGTAGPPDLLDHDGIGVAQDLRPLGRDLADDAHAEAGTGKRLAPHDVVRQAELLADGPHLVLEQQAERLDQIERQVVGQSADVVVRLDVGRRVAARLDDVGVEGALDEVLRALVTLRRRAAGTRARSRATSSKMRMKSSPMILRLRSGSVTPARAAKYRSAAFTWTRSILNWRRKVSSTWSASPARISPVSTKTQVSWSPMALWTSAAATAESTPPLRAHSTRSVPTWACTAATCCSMIETWVHAGRHPQASSRKRSNTSLPRSVWTTSGWNCRPKMPALGVVHGGHRRAAGWWPWPRTPVAPR